MPKESTHQYGNGAGKGDGVHGTGNALIVFTVNGSKVGQVLSWCSIPIRSFLNDSRVYDNDSTMSDSSSGSEIAVIIMCLFSKYILNLPCTCNDI